MSEKKEKDPFAVYLEIDRLRTEYLRELSSLTKIFITLAIAIIGLTMSQVGPNLSQKQGIRWVIGTWAALLISAVFGFLQIYFFSSRYRSRAEYLHYFHLSDLIVALDRERKEDNKLEEFLYQADQNDKRYKRQYIFCIALVGLQAIALLIAFGLFAMFMYSNYFLPCK